MGKKYSEKELLQLAGKLAIAYQELLNGDISDLGYYIDKMSDALNSYNNAIMENANQ